MKQAAHSSKQWMRFAISLVLFLPAFLFPGETLCSDAEELPAGAFLIDMTPLLSTDGRIAAIAPDCRAVTGYIGRSPFIWSRDFGMIRLNAGSGLFGIGLRLSDDGHVMAGIFRSDTQKEIDMGFIWNYDGEVQFMHDLGILKVSWNGLSADGRVAVGHGVSVRQETDFLWSVSDGKRLREISHTISNCDMSPSRDGNKILLENDDRSVVVVDLENGERRELKFGGVSASAVDGAHNCLRAGDPKNPLRRWGRHGAVTDFMAHLEEPDSPMYLNWCVDSLSLFRFLSFDGTFALGVVNLESYDRINPAKELFQTLTRESCMTDPGKTLNVLARLDNNGNAVVINQNFLGAVRPLALSDDGKIALYERGLDIRVWNEDFYRGPRTPLRLKKFLEECAERGFDLAEARDAFQGRHADPLDLKEYLAEFGLNVPSDREIRDAVMSPDGKCFYAELSREDDEGPFPCQRFLACIGDDIDPPRWSLPEGE